MSTQSKNMQITSEAGNHKAMGLNFCFATGSGFDFGLEHGASSLDQSQSNAEPKKSRMALNCNLLCLLAKIRIKILVSLSPLDNFCYRSVNLCVRKLGLGSYP